MNNWKDFLSALGSEKWLADQLLLKSRAHINHWKNGRAGRKKNPPPREYWPDLILIAQGQGIIVSEKDLAALV